MKKGIALLLAGILLVGCFGTLPVFAEEQAERVLLSENFDKLAAGAKPPFGRTTENASNAYLTRVAADGDNMALYIHHAADCECGNVGSPRVSYDPDFLNHTKLTISFRAKSNNSAGSLSFYDSETKAGTTMVLIEEKTWADVVVVIDVVKQTYVSTINGKEVKAGSLPMGELADGLIRFGGGSPTPGNGAYFDDIKVVGIPAEGTVEKEEEEVPAEAAFVPTEPAKKFTTPEGAHVFFNTDFTEAALSAARDAKLTTPDGPVSMFTSATTFGEILDVNGNRMLQFGALDNKAHSPRVNVALSDMAKHYVFDYAIANSGSSSVIDIYCDGKKINSTGIARINDTDDAWHYVHLEIDLEKKVVNGTIDDKAFEEVTLGEIEDPSLVSLRMTVALGPNALAYVDAMSFYTMDELEVKGMLMGNNRVYWDNVKPSKPIDENSFVSNLTPHPRVFVHDWDYMRAHVNDDHMTRQWYAAIKKVADDALRTDFTRYEVNSRGNIIGCARAARNRILALAFVYKIEGDKKYLDRAYAEMMEYGKWPDWSAYVAMLAMAEILQGYAYAYDWLYDDLTAEQRKTIMDILKKHALPIYIYQYEEHRGSVISTGNWNPDINATAIALALAIAEDEPNLAEYILEKAPPCIMEYYTPAYAPQGGYHEGVSYWDLGTSFMLFANDFLENAFVEGFELPDDYLFWKAPGVADTPDFASYFDGPTGRFNYGDCSPGHTNCVVLYWVANRFNKPHYAWLQNKRQTESGAYLTSYDAVAALAWYDADNAYYVPGAFALDKFYFSEDTVNGGTMRSSWNDDTAMFVGLQGGDNSATHQHDSLGTYVVDYMGERFVRTLGMFDYSMRGLKYYDRAEAYNNLVINPTMESDQINPALSKLIKHGTSDNTAFGILDLTATSNDYVDAKRGAMLTDNRNRIIIQDEVTANKPSEFYWFANTDAGLQIAPDGKSVLMTQNGERMLLRIVEAPAEARFEIMDRRSLFDGMNNAVGGSGGKKLYMHFTDKTELNICVEYVGLREGEGIPAPWTYTKLDDWKAEDNGKTAAALSGADVILKLGTPNAYADGIRTFVDPANTEVVPFTENGRTLVPVRFISEAFGAEVGWDEATQTVSVDYLDKSIQLVIGSNQMLVNGEVVTLDVPANTYNARTLIPLRALVETLGKEVFWDDRGLIVIGDIMASYTEEELVKIMASLDVRVQVDGKDAAFFTPERTQYALDVNAGAAVPQISVSVAGVPVEVAQAATLGQSASFTLAGKTYTFKMQPNIYENILGNRDPSVISTISAVAAGVNVPAYETYIYVESLTDSTEFASYPERGIVDGVINTETKNRWAANGEGEWICMDFGAAKNVHSMAFAGVTQTSRAYKFDVLASVDGETWTTVHTGGAPTTNDIMSIIPLGDVQARYIKLVGYGNNENTWNTYAEVRFYESAAQQAEDKSYWTEYFTMKDIKGAVGESVRVVTSALNAAKISVVLRPDAKYTYKIIDEKIATVSADGVVTFVKTGATVLVITAEQDGFSATVEVNVVVE